MLKTVIFIQALPDFSSSPTKSTRISLKTNYLHLLIIAHSIIEQRVMVAGA